MGQDPQGNGVGWGGLGWGGVRSPRCDRGAGTKGRRTAEPSLNKDWVGGGLSLRTPPPAAPAEHRPKARRVERAWRGLGRRCYHCSCTSGAWRWPRGVSRSVLGVPQLMAQPSRPSDRARPLLHPRLGCASLAGLGALSPSSPSVGEQGGGRAARQGLLNWAGSFCGPCQGVLSSGEAEAVLASEYLKLIICIEERGRGALSVGNDLVLSGLHLWLVSAKAE
jgi:hypothetical protein